MIKKISIVIFSIFFPFLILILFCPTDYSLSQSITLSEKKVIYDLPYPGILPDHPLYMLKQIRDKILEFSTRDNLKKAELLLLNSDKKIQMVSLLAKKGKNKLAISTLLQAEEGFIRIPKLVQDSKNQGVSPKEGFIYKLKLSNTKHREIIETLVRQLPQGEEKELNKVLGINNQIKKSLEIL